MVTVLLTGFEPFAGEPINPSLETIKQLDGEQVGDAKLIGKSLPVAFGKSIDVLEKYLDEIKPDIVIGVGQAGGRSAISVERVAINLSDGRIPDNDGNQPVDEPINPDGPVAYWSGLPVKAIAKSVKEAGIPADVSHTAGTYVCNHIFYGLMDLLSKRESVRGGFIHIPFIPEQAVRHPGQPSLALADIVKAVRITVETTLQNEQDITEIGGTIN